MKLTLTLFTLLIFALTGCATLKEKIMKVDPEMSKIQVFEILGRPDGRLKDKQLTVYSWESNFTTCFVSFNDSERVAILPECITDHVAKAISDAAALQMIGNNVSQSTRPTSFGDAYLSSPIKSSPSYSSPALINRLPSSSATNACGIRPVRRSGCDQVCIDRKWVEVCN